VSKADALELYKDNVYKTEMITNLETERLRFAIMILSPTYVADISRYRYYQSNKIMSVAGAYWRGDEKNKQLTRVYGTSFPKQKI
jgi:threonyl-tRNA synthetase